jgi:hypothetical protein
MAEVAIPRQLFAAIAQRIACAAIAALGDGNMNARPGSVRKQREICVLWPAAGFLWPQWAGVAVLRAERTARPCQLPAKATGIVRRQPESEAHMGNVG